MRKMQIQRQGYRPSNIGVRGWDDAVLRHRMSGIVNFHLLVLEQSLSEA